MELLNELYSSGADFVDLHGEINSELLQDNVTVAVPLEYMSEESISFSESEEKDEEAPEVDLADMEVVDPEVLTKEALTNLLRNG